MEDYSSILPKDSVNSYDDLAKGARQVRAAWENLKSILLEILASNREGWLSDLAPSVLEEMRLFEERRGKFIALVPFVIVSRKEGRQEVTLALNIRFGGGDMIVITAAATADMPALTHVLLHELLHASGFVSKEEDLDEATVDYLVDELVTRSGNHIAGEEALKHTPGCSQGCGVLGAAAQFMIDRGLYVLEKEFRRSTERYLGKGIIIDLSKT